MHMVLTLLLLLQVVVVGGVLLIQPYIVRRGLLFGVYVGEERWHADEARAITRRWTATMLAGMLGGLVLGLLVPVLQVAEPPVGFVVSVLVLLATSYGAYLRAYFQARRLAVPGAPAAAAALVPGRPYSLLLPLLSLTVALAAGSLAVGYAWLHYAGMPATVPTHYGPSGRPDAWAPRSFRSVMTLPLGALLIPTSLGILACLMTRAKRAIRLGDKGVSVDAQMRFRQANAWFLSGVVIVTAVMTSAMAVFGVRTGLGLATGIPLWVMALAVVLVVYAVGGSLYLAFRYGQGGARLERLASGAPLTNGVADNSCWYLGGFYVNRDDPSILVEKRFGIGYTINFGNPKAVALFVALLVVIAFIVLSGLTTPQSGVSGR